MCRFGVALSATAVTAVVVPVTVVVAVVIVAIVPVAAAAQTIHFTVGGTEDRAKAAAGFRFCGGREHIQREPDVFKITAGVSGDSSIGTGFRHTSAQRIYHHIDGTEQFYDGEQTDGYIDCHRCAHSCVTVGYRDGVTFAAIVVMIMAGVTAGRRIP